MTNNLERRLGEHNSGQSKSTKARAPFQLVYNEIVESRELARKREKFLKTGCGREFIRNNIPR